MLVSVQQLGKLQRLWYARLENAIVASNLMKRCQRSAGGKDKVRYEKNVKW